MSKTDISMFKKVHFQDIILIWRAASDRMLRHNTAIKAAAYTCAIASSVAQEAEFSGWLMHGNDWLDPVKTLRN